ncbi:MAG: hypothetical protein HOP15_18815 [Planctomycetes bacterium]|nr:hypothetical protein [Planctomycetota bacterium]
MPLRLLALTLAEACGERPDGRWGVSALPAELDLLVRERIELALADCEKEQDGALLELARCYQANALGELAARLYERCLVAFSCKGRGFCPSCCGRRMADTAMHLADEVLPAVPIRRQVLSFPFRARASRPAARARSS